MTNGELNSQLEALKIIAEKAETNQEIIEAIERMQSKLNE